MKYRFRARAHFGYPSPARITTAGRAVSALAFTNEIDVGIGFICRPMLLKIVQQD
jgi:hypothetical protein